MKKIISLSLALTITMLCSACSNTTPGSDHTGNDSYAGTTDSNTTAELKADIPEDAFYENQESHILARGGTGATDWANDDLVVEDDEARGDVVYKAIYDRNLAIEERLGVKIVHDRVNGHNIAEPVRQAVMSQEHIYDVVMPKITDAATFAQENILVPLSEMPYMDLSKPWYDQRCIDELEIGGDNYFFFSDITIRHLDAIWLYYFNKQLIDSYGLEDPYELVESGKWTMDKMAEMIKAATIDDGDSKWTKNDKWGLVAHDYVITASYVGAGERIATANADGEISLTMNNDRVYNVIEKIVGLQDYWIRYALTADNYGSAAPVGFEPSDNYAELLNVFTSGNALFMGECMVAIEDMRQADVEFGLVPSPKLDEEQDEYYSAVNQVAAVMAIPVTNPDLERTSIIIEALAAESHDTVRPAYYETAIKSKYTRDTISAEMLDLILDSVSYDLGIYYNWGELSGKFCHLVYNGGEGFASMYDANVSAAEAALDEFIEVLE
ncbi:MAG: hypothetical protein IJ428_04040 [Clostridia bacterium]|nr:hypothetical protein [Clostridia bacterium]